MPRNNSMVMYLNVHCPPPAVDSHIQFYRYKNKVITTKYNSCTIPSGCGGAASPAVPTSASPSTTTTTAPATTTQAAANALSGAVTLELSFAAVVAVALLSIGLL